MINLGVKKSRGLSSYIICYILYIHYGLFYTTVGDCLSDIVKAIILRAYNF